MDDATVEDDQDDVPTSPGDILNKDPFIFSAVVSSIGSFLQVYGWYVLIIFGITYYFGCKYWSKIQGFFERGQSDSILHRYDNEEVRRRHEGMEEARRRLQEKYSMDAMRHKEEEAEKRRERILNSGKGRDHKEYKGKSEHRDNPSSELKPPPGQSKKRVYRTDDYNPLSGGSSGTFYRPPARRGGGSGG